MSVDNGRTHEPSLRELCAELDGLRRLIDERHQHYRDLRDSDQRAVNAAFQAQERVTSKTDESLREYKLSANEWRTTVGDIHGRSDQGRWLIGLAAGLAGGGVALLGILLK